MEDRNPHSSALGRSSSERDIHTAPLAMTVASTSRHKLDKENVHHRASFTASSPKATATVVKSAQLTPKTAASFRALSPVTSPTLLQQNLSQMSLQQQTSDYSPARSRRLSENNNNTSSIRGAVVMTPTRMLDQGAARIVNPASAASKRNSSSGTTTTSTPRRRVVKCRRRRTKESTGSTGSGGSPDQSFTSSSPGFIPLQYPSSPDPQNTSQWSEASSIYSLAAELSLDITPTRPSPNTERSDCINPVAFTLWRGGQEDPAWLRNEQDRRTLGTATTTTLPRYPSQRQQSQHQPSFNPASSFSASPSPSTSSTTSSSSMGRMMIPAPRQVSNNLRDVYGVNYSREISRPIPMMARRQEDWYY